MNYLLAYDYIDSTCSIKQLALERIPRITSIRHQIEIPSKFFDLEEQLLDAELIVGGISGSTVNVKKRVKIVTARMATKDRNKYGAVKYKRERRKHLIGLSVTSNSILSQNSRFPVGLIYLQGTSGLLVSKSQYTTIQKKRMVGPFFYNTTEIFEIPFESFAEFDSFAKLEDFFDEELLLSLKIRVFITYTHKN